MSNPSEQVGDQSTRPRGAAECKPLLAAAGQDLFRKNAFRVTGLPVDATSREASRHVDELKMLLELGQPPHKKKVAYPLDPPPSIDEIREAIQKIKDPEKRLIDEFFWFWPEDFSDSKSDPSLQFLAKGDAAKANDIWQTRLNDKSYGIVAKHNLAVAYWMQSFELESLAILHRMPEDHRQKITDSWKSSVRKWKRIADDDNLWEKVAERIRQLNEPNLKTGFARQMRTSFWEAFYATNGSLIINLAKSGSPDLAKFYIKYLREQTQRPVDFEKAVERIILPSKKWVTDQIKRALAGANENPGQAVNAARDLLEHSREARELYDLFFSRESSVQNEFFDEIVASCNRLQIIYHKETQDDGGCLAILKAILPLANSTELKKVIEKDISETCARLERKDLENVYNLLKLIQDSQESPAKRLARFKREAASAITKAVGVSGFSENYGFLVTASEHVKELFDTAAIVLRGISLDAWNNHQDLKTAIEANKLAITHATSPELKIKLAEDKAILDKQSIQYMDGPFFGRSGSRQDAGTPIALDDWWSGGWHKMRENPGVFVLLIIVIFVVWGVIGSCNSTTDTPHSTTYESQTPSAKTYTPPKPAAPIFAPTPASDQESYGNKTYRIPSYIKSELDREKAEIEADRAVLKQLDERIDTLGRQIDSDRLYLDQSSQYAVDEFNAKVNRYNLLSQQDKIATAAFNARVDNYNIRLRSNAR